MEIEDGILLNRIKTLLEDTEIDKNTLLQKTLIQKLEEIGYIEPDVSFTPYPEREGTGILLSGRVLEEVTVGLLKDEWIISKNAARRSLKDARTLKKALKNNTFSNIVAWGYHFYQYDPREKVFVDETGDLFTKENLLEYLDYDIKEWRRERDETFEEYGSPYLAELRKGRRIGRIKKIIRHLFISYKEIDTRNIASSLIEAIKGMERDSQLYYVLTNLGREHFSRRLSSIVLPKIKEE